jgi:hypothetical protein
MLGFPHSKAIWSLDAPGHDQQGWHRSKIQLGIPCHQRRVWLSEAVDEHQQKQGQMSG